MIEVSRLEENKYYYLVYTKIYTNLEIIVKTAHFIADSGAPGIGFISDLNYANRFRNHLHLGVTNKIKTIYLLDESEVDMFDVLI